MKKSRKLLCILLALVMVVGLLPGMAFAADVEEADTTEVEAEAAPAAAETTDAEAESAIGDIIDAIGGITLPTYNVTVVTNKGLLAGGATVTMTDQVSGESQVVKTNALGVAVLQPKSLTAVYAISATWDGYITGIKYVSLPGLTWSASVKPDWDTIKVYPIPNIGLNYTDHTAYMFGYKDGTVRPTGTLTRAEAASLIYYIMDPKARDNTPYTGFSDVKSDAWYFTQVSALKNAGIISGTSATTFTPDRAITRGELFTIIGSMFADGYTTDGLIGSIFQDIGSGYFVKYIELLYKLGLVEGDGNGTVRPKDNITRAETATLLNKLILRQPDSESGANCANMKVWPDNQKGAWYYAAIQEATNSHDYTITVKMNPFASEELFCEVWTRIY